MGFFFKSRKEREKIKEAEFLAPQFLRHVNESIDLINSTKNPETFFFRYNFLIKRLNQLVNMEKYISFTGEKPSIALERVMLEKPTMVNVFLERCYEDTLEKASKLKTPKARQRRIEDFCSALNPYLDQMEEDNIEKINELIVALEDELGLM